MAILGTRNKLKDSPLYNSLKKSAENNTELYNPRSVGKNIDNKVYVHKDYAEEVINPDLLHAAEKILHKRHPQFKYNTIMFNYKMPTKIRFDESRDFDTAREPCPKDMIWVDVATEETAIKHTKYVFHHKWMWVRPNYKGFDYTEARLWSETWKRYIKTPSGVPELWREQLLKAGLIDENGNYTAKATGNRTKTKDDTPFLSNIEESVKELVED